MRTLKKCRVCNFTKLIEILSLGNLYLSDFVSDNSKPNKYPLELMLCKNCYLLQLKHTVPQSSLYTERYGYKSGINQTMKKELKEIVEKSLEKIKDQGLKELIAVDIGANDGTLLSYYPKHIVRVGVEPIKKFAKECQQHANFVINNFFNYRSYVQKVKNKKAHIITAISCFYDIDSPNQFLSNIGKILHKDGIFVIQQNYLVSMLEQNAFDNICFKPDTLLLGDNKKIKDIYRGNMAIGENGTLVNIKRKMERQYNGELITIKPTYLESIISTPEHPIKIVKKEYLRFDCGQIKPKQSVYKTEWIEAKNIRKGDYVIVPRLQHNSNSLNIDLSKFNMSHSSKYRRGLRNIVIEEEIAWVLGLYIAEGNTNKTMVGNEIICFTLNEKETAYANRIKNAFAKIGYKTSIKMGRNHTLDIRVSCASLARAFREWFGTSATIKQIPDFLMFASKKIKQELLRGLFAGDGYIRGNKIHFHTSSKVLALQSQLLVASLGGVVGISYVKPYYRQLRGKIIKSSDSWQLRGSSRRLAEIFGYNHRGFTMNHAVTEEDYLLIPIKKISSEHYQGIVHNIETEDNTYLVSNAIVHNCHEHLGYYSLLSLENLLKKHNLEVFDVELSSINGGSFRTYISHKNRKYVEKSVSQLREYENKLKLGEIKIYKNFAHRVKNNRDNLYKFIVNLVKKNKKIYIYGASTRGNTLLQFCNLDKSLIMAAVERNSEKWGKKIASVAIPIISEEQARLENPDYMLVLPWFFKEEFLEREKDYLKGGGHFIFPLPTVEVVQD